MGVEPPNPRPLGTPVLTIGGLRYFALTGGEVGKVDAFKQVAALMLRGKRNVVLTVPVLRQSHRLKVVAKLRPQSIDNRNHRVAVWNGQTAAARETVLDVDDDEGRTAMACGGPTHQCHDDRHGD